MSITLKDILPFLEGLPHQQKPKARIIMKPTIREGYITEVSVSIPASIKVNNIQIPFDDIDRIEEIILEPEEPKYGHH